MGKKKVIARPTTKAITTTAAQILNSKPGRKSIAFTNMSASDVYLRPEKAPTSTLCILLEANGGSYQTLSIEDATLPEMAWYALGAGNVTILVIEVFETNEEE